MKTVTATLQSITPYSPTRAHETPKFDKELDCDYEERTWREKAHVTDTGEVYIPPMALKMCLDASAKFMGLKIPGKKNCTWTKHFASGVLVTTPALLGVKNDDLTKARYHCHVDGVRGSGKRVWRLFPEVNAWKAQVTFHVLDDIITERVFSDTLTHAGCFIGVGRFRPVNGGFFGRFKVLSIDWVD